MTLKQLLEIIDEKTFIDIVEIVAEENGREQEVTIYGKTKNTEYPLLMFKYLDYKVVKIKNETWSYGSGILNIFIKKEKKYEKEN